MTRSLDEVREQARTSLRRHHATFRLGQLSFRFEKRGALVYLALGLLALIGALWGILVGDYGISLGQVFAALTGSADDPLAAYFVLEVRLPRSVGALLVGAALGVSGAIFQTLTGNPLGSPDVIGFTTGAATGALVQIIVFGGSTFAVALSAVAGGLCAALVVYALSWHGGVAGFRLVLVGIGCGAFFSAVNTLLVVRASLESAQEASQWLAGSLNGILWPQCLAVIAALLVFLPFLIGGQRALAQLPLGDELAAGLGTRTERVRTVMLLVGVALMGVATAATGPIAFVALAAPHLVRKLTRTTGVALFGSGVMGALLVVGSDIVARRLFAPNELAVGVITGSLGGLYLIWLLAVERKRL